MLRYIIRRILWSVVLLVICSAVVFAIFYIFPTADPAKLRAGRAASAEQIELIRHSLGLDDPKYQQFLRYMAGVFTPYKNEEKGVDGPFDLGTSIFQNNKPVREIIFDRLPATVFLVTGAVVIWLAIAIPVGIISAVRRRSLLDRTTMITTLAFISAPVFWLGLVALYLFAEDVGQFPIFPGIGSYNDAETFSGKVGLADPALAGAGRGDGGDLRALSALAADRRDVRGLHSHGASQGSLGAASDLAPRGAQRDHPDRHPARARRRRAAGRQRDPHGVGVQHPRESARRRSPRSVSPTCP